MAKDKGKGKAVATTTSKKRKTGPGTTGGAGGNGDDFDSHLFYTAKIAKLHANLVKRNIIAERSFELDEGWGEYEIVRLEIEKQMKERQWDFFNKSPGVAYVNLVKEFHCNLIGMKNEKVYVRGRWVDVSAEKINAVLGLPQHEGTAHADLMSPDFGGPDYNLIWAKLCGGEVKWDLNVQQTRYLGFKREYLQLVPKLWLYYISCRILGSSTLSFVQREKACLIFSIMEGLSVDLGKIIYLELWKTAQYHRPVFCLPSLITKLCLDAGVELVPGEEEIHPKGRINGKYTRNMVGEYKRHHPALQAAEPTGQPQTAPPPPQSQFIHMPGDFVFNPPQTDREKEELQAYWTYSQMALHNNLALIGQSLQATTLGTWIHPSPPPAWHFGPPRGATFFQPHGGQAPHMPGGSGATGAGAASGGNGGQETGGAGGVGGGDGNDSDLFETFGGDAEEEEGDDAFDED